MKLYKPALARHHTDWHGQVSILQARVPNCTNSCRCGSVRVAEAANLCRAALSGCRAASCLCVTVQVCMALFCTSQHLMVPRKLAGPRSCTIILFQGATQSHSLQNCIALCLCQMVNVRRGEDLLRPACNAIAQKRYHADFTWSYKSQSTAWLSMTQKVIIHMY